MIVEVETISMFCGDASKSANIDASETLANDIQIASKVSILVAIDFREMFHANVIMVKKNYNQLIEYADDLIFFIAKKNRCLL